MSMLIAVGAAVAGNCESYLNTVVAELKRAGTTNEEIRGAVAIGQTVKERSAAMMKETAAKLTLTQSPSLGLDAPPGFS